MQITWWLKPARLCLPEKFVLPSERQFHVGIRVPSMTKDPGALRLSPRGRFSGVRIFSSALSMVLIARETVGCETVKSSARSSSVRLWRW